MSAKRGKSSKRAKKRAAETANDEDAGQGELIPQDPETIEPKRGTREISTEPAGSHGPPEDHDDVPEEKPGPVTEGSGGEQGAGEGEPFGAQPAGPDPPAVRPAGEQLGRARELVASGRIQDAIDLYLKILDSNPSNLKAHNNLGVLFDELKQYGLALEHFEEAERLDPNNVEVMRNHGSTLTALTRYADAEVVLKRAGRLAPKDAGVRLAGGVLSFRRGTYAQCETDLRWVCVHDPENGSAFYYLGEALNRLGRFDEAAVAMERAAELMPDDPRPFYTLGRLLDRRHLHADAGEMYRRARALQGPSPG